MAENQFTAKKTAVAGRSRWSAWSKKGRKAAAAAAAAEPSAADDELTAAAASSAAAATSEDHLDHALQRDDVLAEHCARQPKAIPACNIDAAV